MLGYIPSPAHGIVHIGPLQLHAYGLMLAIGVLVAAKIADVRWRRTGHDPKVIAEIAVPVVIGGVDRRPRLPPVHRIQVERGRDHRRVRDLEGRTLDLGRGRRRADRGRDHLAPPPSRHARAARRDRSRRRRRAGDRPLGQLLQPGAVRTAEQAAVGARDRPRAPAGRTTSTSRRSNRRFSTSRSGACSCSARSCGSNDTAVCARVRRSRSTSRCTRFGRVFFEWMRVDPASRIFGIRFNLLLSAVLCVDRARSGSCGSGGRSEPSAIAPGPRPRDAPTADQGSSG